MELTSQRNKLEHEAKQLREEAMLATEAREAERRKAMRTQRSIETMVSNATKLAVSKVMRSFIVGNVRRILWALNWT